MRRVDGDVPAISAKRSKQSIEKSLEIRMLQVMSYSKFFNILPGNVHMNLRAKITLLTSGKVVERVSKIKDAAVKQFLRIQHLVSD